MKNRLASLSSHLAVVLLLFAAAPTVHAALAVSLQPSLASPSPVGRMVSFMALVDKAGPGTVWYRFRVAPAGEALRVVRDFGPLPILDWTATEHEGLYEIEVTVRNLETGETATDILLHEMASNVADGQPAIFATEHPLVFFYSAPPCPEGSEMQVHFQAGEDHTSTLPKQCVSAVSMNFYLAGLRTASEYSVWHTVSDGSRSSSGPRLKLDTPELPLPNIGYSVEASATSKLPKGILLQGSIGAPPFAMDLDGNVVWYYPPGLSSLTRPRAGGFFLGIVQDPFADPSLQIVREFDLAGMTVRETNAARVNEQLAAMGRRPITAFHHEAGSLPDGKILVLASTEEILTDIQGPGDVNVLGDMILVLDENLQVVWVWDAFDHMDPKRLATFEETCTPTGGGCPPFYKTPQANDWLHGNSVQLTPDGNFIFSIRHMDWLIKIDYSNGEGSGQILWRLGKDGDFAIDSTDPYPWFSHQHDASILPGKDPLVLVFDNSNVRYAADQQIQSRGQLYRLDELNRTATLLLNADLGAYAGALGSAQKLANGNYHFNVGWIGRNSAQAVEVDSNGKIVYAIGVKTPVYRSFRMSDLYTP